MMDVKKVVKKIVDYKQHNSHLKEVTLDNEVVYAPFPKDKEKNNYGFMVFSEEETEIKSDCKYKHRYYYYEEFKNKKRKNIIFIMFNPSTASPGKDDQTIRNCRSLVKDEYKSMEIINLFSERRSEGSKIQDSDNVNNSAFLKEFLSRFKNPAKQKVVIAWGYGKDNDKNCKDEIDKINKLLEGFSKMKITVRKNALKDAQNLARHPNQAFWKGFNKKLSKDFNQIAEIAKITKY